jgi:DNA-binding LacI/PurR family transcriptional regulator
VDGEPLIKGPVIKHGKYVTLRDLADACHVSTTTASLALRNHQRISSGTKALVQEAAERLGYRRHPMLSALMVNRSHSNSMEAPVPLAAIYTQPTDVEENDGYHNRVWNGMIERAQELGFKLERFYCDLERISGNRMSQILVARGIQGVIIPSFYKPRGRLDMNWESFSSISIGHSLKWPAVHRVTPNQYMAIRLVLRELESRGYRRPGLVLDPQTNLRTLQQWSSGFLGVQYQQHGTGLIPILEPKQLKTDTLMDWHQRFEPDVIISSDLNILDAMSDGGLNFPDDVGFLSLNRGGADAGIAGIDQNEGMVGSVAIDHLVQMLYYNEKGIPEFPRVTHVSPIWKEGCSVRQRLSV